VKAASARVGAAFRVEIQTVLRPLLPPGSRYVHLAPPNHVNPGDSAIWLGERRCFKDLGVRSVAASHVRRYWRDEVEALGRRDILLAGGGNFGDLWPDVQAFRERVISDFPDRRIVQLPQSIHFRERSNLERARRIIETHPDFTLLVRDRRSLDIAREAFDVPVVLAPDMALYLGSIARPTSPRIDLLWLAREDIEARDRPELASPSSVERLDWMEDRDHERPRGLRMGAAFRLDRRLGFLMQRSPRLARRAARARTAAARRLAVERMVRGCTFLSRGRVVITDRLHGHILSMLMGIPHVCLDNSYGKVSSFVETWTSSVPIVHLAQNADDALARANDLLLAGP